MHEFWLCANLYSGNAKNNMIYLRTELKTERVKIIHLTIMYKYL